MERIFAVVSGTEEGALIHFFRTMKFIIDRIENRLPTGVAFAMPVSFC